MLIDARDQPGFAASNGAKWQLVTDRVMGGRSSGQLDELLYRGRHALRLSGTVSLENDGGFVQMALDLKPGGAALDASRFCGIAIEVAGNGERYGLHLRSTDVSRPWQSYRASFIAQPEWTRLAVPFTEFAPHRIATPLDTTRLRRIGLIAIGRAFQAELYLARMMFISEDKG